MPNCPGLQGGIDGGPKPQLPGHQHDGADDGTSKRPTPALRLALYQQGDSNDHWATGTLPFASSSQADSCLCLMATLDNLPRSFRQFPMNENRCCPPASLPGSLTRRCCTQRVVSKLMVVLNPVNICKRVECHSTCFALPWSSIWRVHLQEAFPRTRYQTSA